MEDISKETKKGLFYTMLKIRNFEEKIASLYPAQEMRTPIHLYTGQEAIAAGVCANLRKDDYVFSTHRNHGHYIAKLADIKYLMAEVYGKVTGCSKGKGGSMHVVAAEYGIPGTSAIVAGGIALAVGTALASKMRKDDKISVTFFGDGATDEGTFQESVNFASLKKLPVIFICENNFYATNSHISVRQPDDDIAKRVTGYGVPASQVDGNDVISVYKAAKDAVQRARGGFGPTLIECRTYRWRGHVGPECDYSKGCRPKEELETWMGKCPLETFKACLMKENVVTDSDISKMTTEINAEIENAVQFAKESPYPDKGDLVMDVYYDRT